MDGPRLDHVSLVGKPAAFERLGFRVTLTAGAPHHGRIFLDRTQDPAAAAAALRAVGFAVEGPEPYRGEDGDWLDVVLRGQTTALQTLTRRLDRAEEEWPPEAAERHPNGAGRLAALRLRLRDPGPLFRLCEALGVLRVAPRTLHLPGDVRIEIESSSEGPDGIVSVVIERRGGTALELGAAPAAN